MDTRRQVDALLAKRNLLREKLKEEQAETESSKQQLADLQEAQTLVQCVAQQLQQTAHDRIGRAVSRCLGAVFANPYEFLIRFDRKRGKTEAKLVLVRDGVEYNDPLEEVGGGVIDVASLSLRLACVMLSKPRKERLLVLDEPFKNVRGAASKRRLRDMLLGLVKDLQFQFILNIDVEAYPEFALGSLIELG